MKSLFQAAIFLLADFAATLFFLILLALTHNVALAIVLGMVLGIAQIGWQFIRKQRPDAMQWMGFFLVIGFGALSLYTHNARFVTVKPSLIYVIVGIVMLKQGWMNRYSPPIVRDNAGDVAILFGYIWAALMFVSAALNGVLAMKLPPQAWAESMSIYAIASKVALFLCQYITLRIVVGRRLRGSTTPAK